MLGALVQDDVIDRDIHRMIGDWRFDLVSRAHEHFRPLEFFVHADDFGAIAAAAFPLELGFGRFVFDFGFGL